jgi:outer membrane porin, OprD family
VTREKSKTSAEFRPMSEVAGVPGVDRGTSVAGFLLGTKNTTYLGAINELTWDLLNIAYVEAGKTWRLPDDFEMRGGVQFIDQRSVGQELLSSFATQLYGASLTASYRSAVLTLAFTSTTTDGLKILRQFGGVPAFNSVIISDFAGAGENSWRVGLSYDFARIGLTGVKGFANYVHGELRTNQHEDEIDATVDYRIDRGPLKNLWLRLRYAHNSLSNQPATEDYRVIVNYTFTF